MVTGAIAVEASGGTVGPDASAVPVDSVYAGLASEAFLMGSTSGVGAGMRADDSFATRDGGFAAGLCTDFEGVFFGASQVARGAALTETAVGALGAGVDARSATGVAPLD